MAKLAAMRYKTYTWPHNPRIYTIDFRREMASHKVPYGRYRLQDLGPAQRVMRGEGAFVGEGAYDEFKKLASVFYGNGPGELVHPVWQSSSAYFVRLSLRQEPRADYVGYTFEFWECYDGYETGLKELDGETAAVPGEEAAGTQAPQTHTVAAGDTLWGIARRYGVALEELLRRNPWLKNPNLIHPGDEVRIR